MPSVAHANPLGQEGNYGQSQRCIIGTTLVTPILTEKDSAARVD